MLDFLILGPLEAHWEDARVELGGSKQRALLAVLLLSSNRTVSRARLVDEIWGEAPPETADKMVQVHVSQLRKVLPEGTLTTQGSGYRLGADEQSLDLLRAQALAREGRAALDAGSSGEASSILSEALSLWRGPALDEFREPFTLSEGPRLEELRLTILEDRIAADLELGRHTSLIGELDAVTRAHPLREAFRAQQMTALYRAGRQADALQAYAEARRSFDEELGIRPSTQLQELEKRILNQDRELISQAPRVREDARTETPTAGRRTYRQPPPVRYAQNDGVNLAYQVFGEGPIDLVLTTGWVLPIEMFWDDPDFAAFLERIAKFARLILWDKRGTGLSDRVAPGELPDLEARTSDLESVLDAAGSKRPAVFGISEGVPLSIHFAATRPDRVDRLCVYGGWARTIRDDDHPWAMDSAQFDRFVDLTRDQWGDAGDLLKFWAPSLQDDQPLRSWWARSIRLGASPSTAETWMRMLADTDVRANLRDVQAPTLVLHREGDRLVRPENARYIAGHIPGAELVELPGEDHLWWTGDQDRLLEPIERFLTGSSRPAETERFLTTVLFTDIADSTRLAAEKGDRQWKRLMALHDGMVREQLERFDGREIKTLGDGFLACFDAPTRAIGCARSMIGLARDLGLEIRAGLHTGECERVGDDISGIAVNTGARIGAEASPGEVLVSRTVTDLVAGSGLTFHDRGSHELAGLPGSWQLFAVEA